MTKPPIPFSDTMYTGFESDEPEIKVRNGTDVLMIESIEQEIEDDQGNVGWSVTCEDEVGYDCFWSAKLQMYVYALE